MSDVPSRVALVGLVAARTTTFVDPDLRDADAVGDAVGNPFGLSGASSIVFCLTRGERRWAVKCFATPLADREERYAAIGRALADLDAPWAVPVELQVAGIEVDGAAYPLLKMGWVDGEDLVEWVRGHLGDQARLAALARRFATVVHELEAAGCAHGDLQHGNVLVTSDDDIVLVDYDGMYVPALAGAGSAEQGHSCYQSPRRAQRWGPWIDRYAAWTIYGSLAALAFDPSLFHRVPGAGDDRLLFGPEDHVDLEVSPTLAHMRASRVAEVAAVAEVLAVIGRLDPADLRSLDTDQLPTLDGLGAWPVEVPEPGPARTRSVEARPLADVADGAEASVVPAAEPWRTRPRAVRVLVPLGLAVGAAVTVAASWFVGLVVLMATAAVVVIRYLLTDERRQRSRSAAMVRVRERQAMGAARRRAEAERRLEQVRDEHLAAQERLQRMGRDIHEAAARAEAAIAQEAHVALAAVWARREEASATTAGSVAAARDAAVTARRDRVLASTPLAPGVAPGVDADLVARARDAGVATAADVTWSTGVLDRSRRGPTGRRSRLSGEDLDALALWRIRVDPSRRGTALDEVEAHARADDELVDVLLALAAEERAIEAAGSERRRSLRAETAAALEELAVAAHEAHERSRQEIGACEVAMRAAIAEHLAVERGAREARRSHAAHARWGFGGWVAHLVAGA